MIYGKGKLLILGLLVSCLTFSSVLMAQVDTTWYWRKGDDPDTAKRTRAELDSLLGQHELWISSPEDNRQGSRLLLPGAHLENAPLESTDLRGAHLENVILSKAHLENTILAETHLENAILFQAHLENAVLHGAYLDSTQFLGADLTGCRFEPTTLPPANFIAHVRGLKRLGYDDNPSALTLLAKQFGDNGFKQQQRDVYCSLKRHNPEDELGIIGYWIEYVLFDLTSEFGSNLFRPWLWFGGIYLISFLIYFMSMQRKNNKGIIIILPTPDYRLINYRAFMHTIDGESAKTYLNYANMYVKYCLSASNNWIPMRIRMIWWALFFSGLCAFNIGFRDINFGRWLRNLTRTEFDIKATGWVRVVAGFQALFSVYLVALWIVSFAGTPFAP